jgi:LmbE family N-acetylglucosaminyl deacetylase
MGPYTLVTFHAHPDDEAISTAGVMAKAAADGHRVVLVVATKGEHGEVADGYLEPDEQLWERRVQETMASAELLGVARVEFLGYRDSGMMGTPQNDAEGSFWRADVEEAAGRLAAILREERAHVLTAYDENGVYGHPDHIQVHRVAARAAQLAGTPKLYLATVDRDEVRRLADHARDFGLDLPGDMDSEEFATMGVPAGRITTRVDVSAFVDLKRKAMEAHASQIPEDSWFLAMAPDQFTMVFGQEWFVLDGAPPGTSEHDLFEGLG